MDQLLCDVSAIFSVSVIVLFCVLVVGLSLMFQQLDDHLKEIGVTSAFQSRGSIRWRLEKWRCNHALVCQSVEQLDQCFGVVLLFALGYAFIDFILASFKILKYGNESVRFVKGLLDFLRVFLVLSMITYVPNRMKAKVYTPAVSLS